MNFQSVENKCFLLTLKDHCPFGGTNVILGKYLQADILSQFFEIFLEDRKIDYLRGNINLFSISAREQKLCPNKLKTSNMGQKIQNSKFGFFFGFFFLIDYIFVEIKSFDSFHLDLLREVVDNLVFWAIGVSF